MEISHIKLASKPVCGRAADALKLLDDEPATPPAGIRHVIINGQMTGARPGIALKK